MTRILIAEDEERITSFLEKGLRANGFSTQVAANGEEALELARSGVFDMLILDIGLPRLDGFEVLGALRGEARTIPVIILTARDGIDDTVIGLEGGADDYIAKPFRFDELLARIRVRLRSDRLDEPSILRVDDLTLDLRSRQALVGRTAVDLSAREFALAEVLFRHAGQVLTREQLLSHVWGYAFDPASNIVDVYIGYLRKKLGDEKITTVRGMGYRMSD